MRLGQRQDATTDMQHLAPLALQDSSHSQHLAASIGGNEHASLIQPLSERLWGQGETIPNLLAQLLHRGIRGVRVEIDMVTLGKPADPLALSLPAVLASVPPSPGSPIDDRTAAVCTCQVGPAGCDGASKELDESLSGLSASLVLNLTS